MTAHIEPQESGLKRTSRAVKSGAKSVRFEGCRSIFASFKKLDSMFTAIVGLAPRGKA